jgi:hypothetical protein
VEVIVEEHPLVAGAYAKFAEVGAVASLYELKVRLLADKEPATESKSTARKVSKTEEAIIKHFTDNHMLTAAEAELLTTARELRNKFLHGEFPAALAIVEDYIGKSFPESGLGVAKLEGTEGEKILEQLFAIIEGKAPLKPIRKTSIEEGRMFGWFLEAHASGALESAKLLLIAAVELIDRISLEHAMKRV